MEKHYRVYINGKPHVTSNPAALLERSDGAIVFNAIHGVMTLCWPRHITRSFGTVGSCILLPLLRRPGIPAGPYDWPDEPDRPTVSPVNYRVNCTRINTFFSDHGYGRLLVPGGVESQYTGGGKVRPRVFRRPGSITAIVIEQEVACIRRTA